MQTPLENALEKASHLTAWIQDTHATVIAAPSDRHSLAAAYFALSVEHREAVVLLLKNGAFSSAFALVRPAYEACMRGFWALSLADEKHIVALLKQNIAPKAENIISALAKQFPNSVFGRLKASWRAMCDFSHGGGLQISRWLSGDRIGPTHSDEDALEILQYVDYVAVLAALGLSRAAGAKEEIYLERLNDWKLPEKTSG